MGCLSSMQQSQPATRPVIQRPDQPISQPQPLAPLQPLEIIGNGDQNNIVYIQPGEQQQINGVNIRNNQNPIPVRNALSAVQEQEESVESSLIQVPPINLANFGNRRIFIHFDGNQYYLYIAADSSVGPQSENRGLSQQQLNGLQRYEAGANEESCPICQLDIERNEKILRLPCRHKYHDSCIIPWLKRSQNCPLCRRNVLENLV